MAKQSIPDSMRVPAFEAAGDMLAALERFLGDIDQRQRALAGAGLEHGPLSAARDMTAPIFERHVKRMYEAVATAREAGWRPTEWQPGDVWPVGGPDGKSA